MDFYLDYWHIATVTGSGQWIDDPASYQSAIGAAKLYEGSVAVWTGTFQAGLYDFRIYDYAVGLDFAAARITTD